MKCSFCGDNMKKGTGKMFVQSNGAISYFCKSKCEKNFGLGRVPKKTKWTKSK